MVTKQRFLVHFGEVHLSPSRGTQSQSVHAERRIISYSTEVHRRYQNSTYVTGCITDDHWKVDGERELSDAWTGFTRFISLNERCVETESTTAGTHVNSSWTHGILSAEEIRVFHACAVVNVKTGGMFFRITQNGESVQLFLV